VSQILDGPISADDWLRFDQYARRIRHLSHRDTEDIDASVYMRLIQHRKSPLLPRLSTLCSIPYGPLVWSILSPTLRSVTVDVFDGSRYSGCVWALMDVLGDIVAFPCLEKFHLEV
jgi:hypothetical protein